MDISQSKTFSGGISSHLFIHILLLLLLLLTLHVHFILQTITAAGQHLNGQKIVEISFTFETAGKKFNGRAKSFLFEFEVQLRIYLKHSSQ